MIDKQMCDEEFNKYFEEETNKQTFNIKMEEPMKLIINYDYYFLLLKKLERLESKIEILKKSYSDDVRITKTAKIINNLKPLTEEETGIKEMLKLAYKEDNIKNLETSLKTICHLEDFEIAIWNIKEIIKGDINE